MADTALLVVDMLNAYRHPDADVLAGNVADIVEPLAGLINEARGRDDVELIYVNDNYGDFTAEPSDLIGAALAGARPDLVRPIAPEKGCRVMTKVRHSAFYATPAHIDADLGTAALAMMELSMSAEIVSAAKCLK